MTTITQGSAGVRTLHLAGLGHATIDRAGPSLLAAPDWTLAVAIADDGGLPIAGLAAERFAVTAVITRRNGAGALALPVRAVSEPVAGVYVLQLDRDTVARLGGTSIPCVIDVRGASGDSAPHGRTLVRLGD